MKRVIATIARIFRRAECFAREVIESIEESKTCSPRDDPPPRKPFSRVCARDQGLASGVNPPGVAVPDGEQPYLIWTFGRPHRTEEVHEVWAMEMKRGGEK